MTEYRSPKLFEDLSVELIRLIFEYLAPHDLLNAFEELNSRFLSIILQHPLCLPNNRRMSRDVYYDYILHILPDYSSQIVYLHLSERRAPHAVHSLLGDLNCQKPVYFSALKAITVEDVPVDVYNLVMHSFLPLNQLHSLSIDFNGQYFQYRSDYNSWTDIDFVVPLLNSLSQLRSLYLRISSKYDRNYMRHLRDISPRIVTHLHLHTLSIDPCSRQLFVELLGKNRLPKLRQLNVAFPYENRHDNISTMQSHQIPLDRFCVPELRRFTGNIYGHVQWLLSYFEDVYHFEQLEQFTVHGHLNFSEYVDLPTATVLCRWLAMAQIKQCVVQLHLSVFGSGFDRNRLKSLHVDYNEIFGSDCCDRNGHIYIHYPMMLIPQPENVMNIKSNQDESEEEDDDDDSIDVDGDELNIFDSYHSKEEWIDVVYNVSRWWNLRKISIIDDSTVNEDTIGQSHRILLHVVQRSPRFCKLEISGTRAFCHALSRNIELCTFLVDHLEILRFSGEDKTSSFLDLVEIVDAIFSHSSSSPLLKKLTITVDADPALWLTFEHFQSGLRLVLDRFPILIHFTLYCCYSELFHENTYDLTELISEWYREMPFRHTWSWRSTAHAFDLWL